MGAFFTAQALRLDAALASAPDEDEIRDAAEKVKAFADPTRLRLAVIVRAADEICVTDLGTISGVEQTVISHHLTTLRRLRLAQPRREGKLALYSLTDEGRRLLDAVFPS
ncbi:MAG: ArsR family transcriptional regulator, lead/cadmium/zinc/bismuth-responsive transcriptional [Thermoleophilaceae bacterium]|jgi:DNA-binding transcriptional ArsR family regulator|nr:ArsR family transcriptional regulator, lead/cadmium/zinc/bismuth-responsive transcriptional [Thermoleophilaceae bacterium]